MLLCYVDEAGCTGLLPAATSPIQPAFCMLGLAIDADALAKVTHEFLSLKRRYFPNRRPGTPHLLDWILVEIKGSDLRTNIRGGTKRSSRHAIRFLSQVVQLLESHGGRIFGRVYVKGIDLPIDGTSMYTYSLRWICLQFQQLLTSRNEQGFVIVDSRNKHNNTKAAHSIFTGKFRAGGDEFPALLEMATFGHSDNHVGLQLVDLLCSGILFPLVMHTYCTGFIRNVHVEPKYGELRPLFCERLKALQHRYHDGQRWQGGR